MKRFPALLSLFSVLTLTLSAFSSTMYADEDNIDHSGYRFTGGRASSHNHARAVAVGGGTPESERAVALGLQWIANHQLPNGSWSFNHQLAPSCQGACKNPGKYDKEYNAATGLALLSFLGAGVTHKEGRYKKNVYNGLYFLLKNGKTTSKDDDFFIGYPENCVIFVESKGTMYSQGIVALCLTEAYAKTRDKRLLPAAQGSLNYIYFHQDPNGGGWRYRPHQAGDISVTGWQMAAIRTANTTNLDVPDKVVVKASRFLDSVQTDSGAKYGYSDPGEGPSTTAVGLLTRMNFGWEHDNPALQRGVEWLSKIGPSKTDSYHNYYATEVMFQYNGPLWEKWNAVMRDQLVDSQVQQGHEKGSWYHAGPWSDPGGRLYDTAMSTMILEVYYRHPRIYKTNADQK
ncbi:MAG: terpene cyclase/mutase family protein [Thermoguttaceae bacterium]|nr:terpene cyclase/mutase family protein [Thermoguttaceae bacterium]